MIYTTSTAGLALIKRWEGCKLVAYQDVAGVWTIGYGHTRTAKQGMRIGDAEAEVLLRGDLLDAEKAVNRLVKVPLEQREFDALVSFTFNLGVGALERSTLLRLINAGDKLAGAITLVQWNKAIVGGKLTPLLGLVRRRVAELQMFLG